MKRFALFLTFITCTALAEAQGAAPTTTNSIGAAAERSPYFSTSSHHARLDAVVKQIADASGENVILSAPGVPPDQLPMIDDFELRDVTVPEALKALTEITLHKISLVTDGQSLFGGGVQQDHRNVFILKYIGSTENTDDASEQLVKVYNLSSFAGESDNRLSDLLSLIDTAIGEGAKPFATVKLHRQTNTLIVKGTVPQQTVVSDVIASQAPQPKASEPAVVVNGLDNATVGQLNSNQLGDLQNKLETELDRVRQLRQLIIQTTTSPTQR